MKNKLSEIRKQHRMNQQELADVLEVTRQTIGSIENGRYDPSLQLAFKIARYFDMAIEEIFSDERGEGYES
ncbi:MULTISPECIES: helix-turn-helix transcriptional regulator [Allobacillus]|uniref:Helix-turn-helix transcriptional regulator n=1 Tax=Allobacillus halotolerans TaxID=570278 RepID=A0ABS6GTJ3_9BACI|nr:MULTISPECIES: helix-turn-helix transcriptional regulator [Allobacillus]MBU6081924.1 helix-turn-helix transcriptional regulator [Allobacillus halotolerans]TSJ67296.1 helix-turn-helix transcriptional regulator [Allobacillus sp. SKP2-8]